MKNHFIILAVVAVLAVATLDATPSGDRPGKIFICKVILSTVIIIYLITHNMGVIISFHKI